MDAVGAEVGQKMRSAIKAKLTELECYVDDELPDYIMVMVANKRSKSQMNEDLNLFLKTKTTIFVEWLHIVLKKLKEVTVTNPEIYKKVSKRKGSKDEENLSIKKEKKDKKSKKLKGNIKEEKCLTDNLPINIKSRLGKSSNKSDSDDGFDIPLLSEVNKNKELEEIEKQIVNVKSRLGDLVHSEDEEQDVLKIKTELNELIANKAKTRNIVVQQNIIIPNQNTDNTDADANTENKETEKKAERKRITFDNDDDDEIKTPPRKKQSALSRLGKRPLDVRNNSPDRKSRRVKSPNVRSQVKSLIKKTNTKVNSDDRELRKKGGILSRLGVQSKVSIPDKPEETEEVGVSKEVRSMIRVKPRTLPPNAAQANKTLILKAVAEAQRSIAQAPKVGIGSNSNPLFTKKYLKYQKLPKTVPEKTKARLNSILVSLNNDISKEQSSDSEEEEYIPKPVGKNVNQFSPEYTPTSPTYTPIEKQPKFVVNLNLNTPLGEVKRPTRSRSPIVFDIKTKPTAVVKTTRPNIPDKLPVVPTVVVAKKKEACIYFPNCMLGDKCEYAHIRKSCEMFPHCKFGDKCLYLHPSCKFGTSCTKRDCPYNHVKNGKSTGLELSNVKPCKFGKFCKNATCKFNHPFATLNKNIRS
ncbi:unnamed protein product [Brassicogethes aeneus]|uniref:Zinc finger CCCH domain-containing protein 14 n=1 Tax=Brassicogethes aeneus TaxID=1431903 RepID=A0A9P0FKK1_BRAAE|nr:unnamed protein product [Brassicogethes aeneus]